MNGAVQGQAGRLLASTLGSAAQVAPSAMTLNERAHSVSITLENVCDQLEALYFRVASANQAPSEASAAAPSSGPLEMTVARLEAIAARAQDLASRLQLIA